MRSRRFLACVASAAFLGGASLAQPSLGGLATSGVVPAGSQQGLIAGRRGFSIPEQPAPPAGCGDLQAALDGLPEPQTRIDPSVVGTLTFIQTDGALWYLAVCSAPGIRVMCVTYDDNGMKLGERVTLRGGYSRQDEHHVVLDPCLASRP